MFLIRPASPSDYPRVTGGTFTSGRVVQTDTQLIKILIPILLQVKKKPSQKP